MTHTDLCERTMVFAIAVAKFARRLDNDVGNRHAAGQLIRASASAAANYRAAGVARSHKESIAKLGIVIEEADESVFWCEYVTALNAGIDVRSLRDEGEQLTRIFTASRNTARRNRRFRPPDSSNET